MRGFQGQKLRRRPISRHLIDDRVIAFAHVNEVIDVIPFRVGHVGFVASSGRFFALDMRRLAYGRVVAEDGRVNERFGTAGKRANTAAAEREQNFCRIRCPHLRPLRPRRLLPLRLQQEDHSHCYASTAGNIYFRSARYFFTVTTR